jgi:hypothetical protein
MAKVTKTATTVAAPASAGEAASTITKPIVDINSLTPAQLAALQKQLKERKKETAGKSEERFAIVDKMLQEKDKDKNFVNTTRDICNALKTANLVDTTIPGWDTVEIKKIQARKQFLEKKTDEKGKLVYPEGTFGYKPAEGGTFAMSPVKVTTWFQNKDNVAKLDADQLTVIRDAVAE